MGLPEGEAFLADGALQQYENEGEAFLADGGENKAVKNKAVKNKAINEKNAKASKEFVGGAYSALRTVFRVRSTLALRYDEWCHAENGHIRLL